MDGKGTATGGADALAQAIALKPDAIILGSVSIENNKTLIKQAADQGIVVIGWHATDKPGPVADPPVFTNVGTDPYQIAYTAGEYAVVHSNGTAGAEVISDRQYPIVVMKSDGIENAIKECKGCTLLSEDNAPFGEVPQRTPGADQLAPPALRRQARLHPDLQRGLFRLRGADAEGRRHRSRRPAASDRRRRRQRVGLSAHPQRPVPGRDGSGAGLHAWLAAHRRAEPRLQQGAAERLRHQACIW